MFKPDKSTAHHFIRRTALEEFNEYTSRELERLRHSDQEVDEKRYREAIDLVVGKLGRKPREPA